MLKLESLTLEQLEGKQRALRYSVNKRTTIGVNKGEYEKQKQQIESKIKEVKGKR